MEKKKKVLRILARVLAIVTALVCTLCMVVPSYAEETETEQDLATTIAGQEETLNALYRDLNMTFDAGDYLQSVGKTYDDVNFYGKIDSDFDTYTYSEFQQISSNYYYGFYVRVYYRDSAGYSLRDAYSCAYVSINTFQGEGYRYTFYNEDYEVDYRVIVGYDGSWIRIQKATPDASWTAVDTTHFVLEIIGTYPKFNPVLPFVCSRTFSCDPSMLLSLSLPDDTVAYEEGYQAGVQDGYETGYDAGVVEGWDAGHTEGYTNGLDQGYRDGYDDGMTQMSLIDLVTGILRAPMTLIESALNFDIFGINMSNAVKALVSMALLAVVITIVWKAVK